MDLEEHKPAAPRTSMSDPIVIDDSSDESADELSDDDESEVDADYQDGPKRKRKRVRKSRAKPAAARLSALYLPRWLSRQPAYRAIDDVQQTEAYQAGLLKVKAIIADISRAKTSRDKADDVRARLEDRSASWAIVMPEEVDALNDEGGPCTRCVEHQADCIVQIAPAHDHGPARIVEKCIACAAPDISCDLRYRRRAVQDEAPTSLVAPSIEPPNIRSSSRTTVAPIPPAATIRAPKRTRTSNTIPSVISAPAAGPAPTLSIQPITAQRKVRTLEAIDKVRGFVVYMKGLLEVKDGKLGFEAEMMLEDAEESLITVQQYVLLDGPDGHTVTPVDGIEAIRHIQIFVDWSRGQREEAKGAATSESLAIIFRGVEKRVVFLTEVVMGMA